MAGLVSSSRALSRNPNDPPIRIPKLKVRSSVNTVTPAPSYIAVPEPAPRPVLHNRSDSQETNNSWAATSPRPDDSPARQSTPNNDSPNLAPKEDKKAKRGNVFAFLTLKEPSQQAFQEYAKAQRKQAALKGSTAARVMAVSQQKLPAHVPKVNSKWDGMPDNARREASHGWKKSLDFTSLARDSPKPSRDMVRRSASTQRPTTKSSSGSSRKTIKAESKSETKTQPRPRTRDDDPLPDLERLSMLGDATSDRTATFNGPQASAVPAKAAVPELYHSPPVTMPSTPAYRPKAVTIMSDSSISDFPLTPDDVVPIMPQISSQSQPILKVQQFKSVEEIPQWPLATNPDDVIIYSPNAELPLPTTPSKAAERETAFPAGEASEMRTPESGEGYYAEEYFPEVQTQPSYPSPDVPYTRSPSQSLQASFRGGVPNRLPLIPPRKIPGRAVIKDTDLDTIPESETASILARGGEGASARTSMALDDHRPAAARASMAESRPSSEISAQFYQSPHERMGLGGLVKVGKKNAPWPPPAQEDEGFVVEGSPAMPGREGKGGKGTRTRTGLMGKFKR